MPRREALPAESEASLQRKVQQLAGLFGWEAYHTRFSVASQPGWPDLALVRPPRLVLAELKRQDGRVTPAQQRWLALLGACTSVETYLWRPADLELVAAVLRGEGP
ncbi:MAG TPA: VRR-NUC domain-containing protein [Dehalococcoidia bacterium]|nr:VRR-NUC domain-containing protein [Dehalococcoidia bacterium]